MLGELIYHIVKFRACYLDYCNIIDNVNTSFSMIHHEIFICHKLYVLQILHVTDSPYKFHSFSNCEAAGQFMNDVTPNETEYIGYFNVAQKVYMADE